MLNKSETGIYYLEDQASTENSNYTNENLKNILDLRKNKEEAIDYYLELLEENLKDHNLQEFDIVTSVPDNQDDYISEGIKKLLKKLSSKHEKLEFVQCLDRSGNTINSCCKDLKNKNILLFDYVATKGTSLKACKETLKSAEANLIVCIALQKSSL
ncbi:MAG: phosphoribosyltransferase [Clostridium sp.]|jgi:predicted amidophosphoribosyltransferase|nr:phosphoribosyltransferase [Clostridium sp.]